MVCPSRDGDRGAMGAIMDRHNGSITNVTENSSWIVDWIVLFCSWLHYLNILGHIFLTQVSAKRF